MSGEESVCTYMHTHNSDKANTPKTSCYII